jgi:galactokinase
MVSSTDNTTSLFEVITRGAGPAGTHTVMMNLTGLGPGGCVVALVMNPLDIRAIAELLKHGITSAHVSLAYI